MPVFIIDSQARHDGHIRYYDGRIHYIVELKHQFKYHLN